MHDEPFAVACAADDLTARLSAELTQASLDLATAERRCTEAVRHDPAGGTAVPRALRRELMRCRRHFAALRQMLEGVLDPTGGHHAACA